MIKPTIEIKHPSDPRFMLRINEDDFDPSRHTLWNALTPEEEFASGVSPDPSIHSEAHLKALAEEEQGWRKLKAIYESEDFEKLEDVTYAKSISAFLGYLEAR